MYGLPIQKMLRSVWKTTKCVLSVGHLVILGSHFFVENIHVHRILHIPQIVSIHFIYGLPIRKMLRSVWKTTTKDILSRPSWLYRQPF